MRQWESVQHAAARFFGDLAAWQQRQTRGTGRVREPNIVADSLSEELTKLGSELRRLADDLQSDEEKIELTAVADRCVGIAEAMRQWLDQSLAGQVYWLETRGERTRRLALASAPIEVGPA